VETKGNENKSGSPREEAQAINQTVKSESYPVLALVSCHPIGLEEKVPNKVDSQE
jgi:hypothetical protein